MVRGCSRTEHQGRAGAVIRRTAAYAGISIIAVGAATLLAASPAEAADIELDEATSAEIEDHLAELETERDDTAERLRALEARLADARAVVDEVADEYGSVGAQLGRVTLAVDAAEEDLGAKMSTLVGFARERSDKFDRARAAEKRAGALGTEIEASQALITGIDEEIEEARAAAEEAAEAEAAERAEAQAKAKAKAEAEAEAEESQSSSSGSSGTTTASYSADAATAAVAFARDQLGEPYVYGSAGPDTWDCSGLVKGAYAVSGITLTHQTNAIWAETDAIGRDDLRPGDLVFYAGLGHMAIYIGGGEVIHAPSSGDVVKISDIDMMGIDGYRRV